jgi:hypothetical protein
VCIALIVIGSFLVRYFKTTGIIMIVFGSLALVTLITINILLNFTPEGKAVQGALNVASFANELLGK